MYATLDVDALTRRAEIYVLQNDRLLYLPFFVVAERFCKDNKIVIGGAAGVIISTQNTTPDHDTTSLPSPDHDITSPPLSSDVENGAAMIMMEDIARDDVAAKRYDKDSFFWELYCDNTFDTVKKLANTLAKTQSRHVDARTVALQTNIKYKEYTISVDARALFKIYALDKYRGVELVKLFTPVKARGPFSGSDVATATDVDCFPPEIFLMMIYRDLYNFSKASTWNDTLLLEKKLFDKIADEKAPAPSAQGKNRHAKRRGGDDEDSFGEDDDLAEYDESRIMGGDDHKHKAAAQDALSKYILIGDFALQRLGIAPDSRSSRLQFIVDDEPAIVVKKIQAKINAQLSFATFALNIPGDFQTIKHTIYIHTGGSGSKSPIADIYNSTTFETIPYVVEGGSKIGGGFVLLRFIFVDLWTLRMIGALDSTNNGFIKERTVELLVRATKLRAYLVSNPKTMLFPLTCDGQYINEQVAKKKLMRAAGQRFGDIYPAMEGKR